MKGNRRAKKRPLVKKESKKSTLASVIKSVFKSVARNQNSSASLIKPGQGSRKDAADVVAEITPEQFKSYIKSLGAVFHK